MAWTCSKKGKFTIDMSMFHEKRRLHCPFCALNFVTIANLGCHIKSTHGIEKPREKRQILPTKKAENIEKRERLISTNTQEDSIPQIDLSGLITMHDTESELNEKLINVVAN